MKTKIRTSSALCACLTLYFAAFIPCYLCVDSFVAKSIEHEKEGGRQLSLSRVPLKIACWVMTTNSSDDADKFKAIAGGWGKGCDALESIDRNTPGIEADWADGYERIAGKSYRAWLLMNDKYLRSGMESKP